jgi:hypothetical protein
VGSVVLCLESGKYYRSLEKATAMGEHLVKCVIASLPATSIFDTVLYHVENTGCGKSHVTSDASQVPHIANGQGLVTVTVLTPG